MLKIINASVIKLQQRWLEEVEDVDWGEDEDEKLINDQNLEDYLIDEVEETDAPPSPPSPYESPDLAPAPPPEMPLDDYRSEIPTINEFLTPAATREIIYSGADNLISDGINRREVIGFDYINRHGAYAGWRTVEPHYTFHAFTTNNMILVGWDRDVNDIRAFIIGNVQPNGVRYEEETFDPRSEIMTGINASI